MVFVLLGLVGCYREEPEQIVTVRDSNWQDKNDPNDMNYMDNRHPFFTDDGLGGTVFFKDEREEDEDN